MSDPLTPQQRRDMNLREEGAALERKRVVAWLRSCCADGGPVRFSEAEIADRVERLDHLLQPEGES